MLKILFVTILYGTFIGSVFNVGTQNLLKLVSRSVHYESWCPSEGYFLVLLLFKGEIYFCLIIKGDKIWPLEQHQSWKRTRGGQTRPSVRNNERKDVDPTWTDLWV